MTQPATETRTLTFNRSLVARPAKVHAALIEPAARMAWGPPDADAVVLIENQPAPAPGIRETARCGPVADPYVTVTTDWIEITPDRISYAETLEAEGMAFATTLAIFDLAAKGVGTDLNVTLLVASFAGPDVLPEVEGGWTHAMRNFEAYLTGTS